MHVQTSPDRACTRQVRDTEPVNLAHAGELEHAGAYLSERGYALRRDRTMPRLASLVAGSERATQHSQDSEP